MSVNFDLTLPMEVDEGEREGSQSPPDDESSPQDSYSLGEMQNERRGSVGICWFPKNFSQSCFGTSKPGSNACTLIALLVAERCYAQGIKIYVNDPDNKEIVNVFASCILRGNRIHESLHRRKLLKHINLSVPEAIEAAGDKMRHITEWCSNVFMLDLSESLYEDLKERTEDWYANTPQRCGSDLYVILIADSRSVLFVFQKDLDKVSLVDSHQHSNHKGAVIAQVSTSCLLNLCSWYIRLLRHCYDSEPTTFELSYLYFKRMEAGGMTIA